MFKLCVAYAAKLCNPLYDAVLKIENINETNNSIL
jgi:hypothetical protein